MISHTKRYGLTTTVSLLSLLMGASAQAYPNKVVKPQANTHVLYHETFPGAWWEDIDITSQFPVSSLRYNDHYYLEGGTPLYGDELVVVVKSDCSEAELAQGGVLTVDAAFNDEERVNALMFTIMDENTTDSNTTVDIDDLFFMETSTFAASWAYTSFWCSSIPGNEDQPVGISKTKKSSSSSSNNNNKLQQNGNIDWGENWDENASVGIKGSSPRFLLTVAATLTGLLGFFGGTDGSQRGSRFPLLVAVALISVAVMVTSNNESRELADSAFSTKVCQVNVEILHDGCRPNPLVVNAPAIQIADVELTNQQSTAEDCTTYYKADLTFPNSTIVSVNATTTTKPEILPQLDGSVCYRAVEGRPFMDKNGHQLQASTSHDKTVNGNGWSSCSSAEEPTQTHDNQNNPQRQALGRKWAQRALGEHASVSSFAAFTMALMANNAPPTLIQDSLVAASDEVRHAKVAFQTASLFLGQPVEPGPLPPSSHAFQHNLTALAIATAREGCIDETLSALLLALEVDEQVDALEAFVTAEEQTSLKDSMTVIALEEATHSALAWRTIEWVCAVDKQACKAVENTVLAPALVEAAVQARLQYQVVTSPEKIEQAWSTVYETLAPYAMHKGGSLVVEAASSSLEQGDGKMPLTSLVPHRIVQAVMESSRVQQA